MLQEKRGFFYKRYLNIAFFECENRHLVQVHRNKVLKKYYFLYIYITFNLAVVVRNDEMNCKKTLMRPIIVYFFLTSK
jgi:hypothetical protein